VKPSRTSHCTHIVSSQTETIQARLQSFDEQLARLRMTKGRVIARVSHAERKRGYSTEDLGWRAFHDNAVKSGVDGHRICHTFAVCVSFRNPTAALSMTLACPAAK
jgi:hypothetical protein